MTGIAAVVQPVGKTRLSAESALGKMQVRGYARHVETTTQNDAEISVGICQSSDQPTPLRSANGGVFVMDGVSFDVLTMERLRGNPGLVSLEGMMELPGAFAFISNIGGGLVIGRDPLGQKPLYYTTDNSGTFALASLKRAITVSGFENPVPVPPGRIFDVSNRSLSPVFDASLTRPHEETLSEDSSEIELAQLVKEGVLATFPKGSSLAFSGGLDSALIAHIAKILGLEPMLVTVGLRGQRELENAQRAAKALGLGLHVREFTETEVIESVTRVVEIIESDDPVLVGISIPLLLACEEAARLNAKTIAMGQMSDELFGGYGRFEDLALTNQTDELKIEIWKSVLEASVKDFDTGDKLASSCNLELRCPLAYLPLVRYGLRIPVSLKLKKSHHDVTRKFILRKAAEKMGLPLDVASRPKKAVQYSTGVQKILVKEAKKRSLTMSSLIKSIVAENAKAPAPAC